MGKLSGDHNLFEILKKADEGDLDAMSTAIMLLPAEGYLDDDPDIYERYLSYLHTLIEAGDSTACIILGDAYANGSGVAVDGEKAIEYYAMAAERGESFGYECIGMLYYAGEIIQADYKAAFEYFTKVDGHKSFCTLYSLGEMYRVGLYVEKDLSKACEYYREIAFSDEKYADMDDYYWCACYRLGHALHTGEGVPIDPKAAYGLLSKAKALVEKRGDSSRDAGITYDEVFTEWAEMSRDLDLL